MQLPLLSCLVLPHCLLLHSLIVDLVIASGKYTNSLNARAFRPINPSRTMSAVSSHTPRIAMISGHTDLEPAIFQAHYHTPLDQALARGDSFILGDAAGTDTLALEYLLSPSRLSLYPNLKSRITVYASRRSNVAALRERGVRVVEPNDHDNAAGRAQTPQSHSSASFRGGRGGGRGRGRGRAQDQQALSAGPFSTVVVNKQGRDARRYHHVQRDAAMTAASDYDILYVRTEEESRALYGPRYRPRVSATELNRRRRAELLAAKRTEGVRGEGAT